MNRLTRILMIAVLSLAAAGAEMSAAKQAAEQSVAEPGERTETAASEVEVDIADGSYAVGCSAGAALRNGKMEVVTDELLRGLLDALAGDEGRLTAQQVAMYSRRVSNAGMRRVMAAAGQDVDLPAAAAEVDIADGSYAVGYVLGSGMLNQKLEIVTDELVRGLLDILAGDEGRLTFEQIDEYAGLVRSAGMRRVKVEQEAIVAKNRAEAEAYLTANAERPGVVSLESGLQYEVLSEGDGPRPKADTPVKVDFRGTLIDGTVFDSSYDRGEPIVVSPDRTIPAWAEAVPMMPVGSTWRLFVPSHLFGLGDISADNIPMGGLLIYDIELLAIEPAESAETAPVGDAQGGG